MDAPSQTPYSQQLRDGFRALRFGPALEAEYRAYCSQGLLTRFRLTALLALLVWLLFCASDFLRIGWTPAPELPQAVLEELRLARLLALATMLAATLYVQFSGSVERAQLAMLAIGYAVATGAAYGIYCYKQLHLPHESSMLVIAMMALFIPIGARMRWHLGLALSYIAAVVLMTLLAPNKALRIEMAGIVIALLLALVICTLSAYWREYLHREQFLYRGDAQWLALRDEMTGLSNRRMFNHHLDTVMRQAQREGQRVALLLLDVDHFKLYNDRYGHAAGDRALQTVAAVLQSFALRPLDLAARLGGEEMALVLYDPQPSHAAEVAQALVDAIAARRLPHEASPVAPVLTVSLGCALLRKDDNPDRFYRRADALLYQAKGSGRNRCCVDGVLRPAA
ncbi:diguanylate cyclase [Paucibacter sp. APW11]|uniref:diguanylate cyclase n=1 Tax=Roseateles aquae TaxID=3077235 RepID=A0ABU3PEV9_9BURK|nr:diguanylate cyclase [Paucibacter sp. APW11]MDT9001058.1 diguanylate cyclase [Paucibacter sp. APW11]